MEQDRYTLPLPTEGTRPLAVGWLWLALLSLVGSGLVVILIVLARTPVIHELVPWIGGFKTALVVHVDLSVLVWFLSFAGLLGSFTVNERNTALGGISLGLASLGALSIALSPLFGGQPFMNNYVPVLENYAFFIGCGLFSAGITGAAIQVLFYGRDTPGWDRPQGVLQFGVKSALLVYLLVALAWVWTYGAIPEQLEGEYFYEVLFWGGGHILQFTHTQLLIVVWLWLVSATGRHAPISPRVLLLLLALGVAPVFISPGIYLFYDVDSIDLRMAFTYLMRDANGLAVVPVGLVATWVVVRHWRVPEQARPQRNALAVSLFLFALGGILGFLIDGVNVIIPAHYHGSIVAITMAYMGLTFHLIPKLGFRSIPLKWATWQPVAYGVGQTLHVTGLAWSGGHGVQRKTAGAAQGLDTLQQQLAMGMMGLGGVIAIASGALFLVLALRAIWPEKRPGRG